VDCWICERTALGAPLLRPGTLRAREDASVRHRRFPRQQTRTLRALVVEDAIHCGLWPRGERWICRARDRCGQLAWALRHAAADDRGREGEAGCPVMGVIRPQARHRHERSEGAPAHSSAQLAGGRDVENDHKGRSVGYQLPGFRRQLSQDPTGARGFDLPPMRRRRPRGDAGRPRPWASTSV
jgi:hypothetical protein